MNKTTTVREGISYIGQANPDLRVFDIIMETKQGTTYNSYVVRGTDKCAVIDANKLGFGDKWIEDLRQVVDPSKIDYIVLNHTEPDHSGALGELLDLAPNATVVGSSSALIFASKINNRKFPSLKVKHNDTLDLGGVTLQFIEAPFLHWPDSIFTFVPERKVLFTCDFFGSHFCWTDLFGEYEAGLPEARKYYFDCIFAPFPSYVLSALEKISALDYDMVCPSHGPILQKSLPEVRELYRKWAEELTQVNDPKLVYIGYVSAYGNTQALGEKIADALREEGLQVVMQELNYTPLEESSKAANRADAVLFGSPTINRDALEPVWEVLSHLSAITNRGKKASAFGSFGWTGEAVGMVSERLTGLGYDVSEGLKIRLVPSEEELTQAYQFGKEFAARVKS